MKDWVVHDLQAIENRLARATENRPTAVCGMQVVRLFRLRHQGLQRKNTASDLTYAGSRAEGLDAE